MAENTSPLRLAREAKGLSLGDVARLVGVSRQAVSFWELGAVVPRGPARRLLAGLFSVPLEVIDSWFAREEKAA